MSLCINPQCPQPDHPDNGLNRYCQACGSDLLLQGRYRVMRLISSQSGFGKVYEAYERNLPKILKVLKESHQLNSKVLELFQREATVLGRLNHPGVPRVETDGYFVYQPKGSDQPLHCIVMEKIDGPNLKQWMVQQGNHPISEQQALLWLTQLADVLHLVHQQNYFHRDIKPENIMLRSNGQLVLVDFGAAREMTETYLAHLGASGITTVSSAGYTPPEQEQGQAVPQSDFYALGRTIIYLLTGKTPSDPTIYDSRTNAFNWRLHAPQVSSNLGHLIDDLIAPRAIDRPQTTQEILQRLAAVRAAQPLPPLVVAESGTVPEAPSWPTTTLGDRATPAPQTALQMRALQAVRRSVSWRWILPGIVVLGLLVGLPLIWTGIVRSRDAVSSFSGRNVPTAKVTWLQTLKGHQGSIKTLLLLDSTTLISGGDDKVIRLWNLEQGKEIRQLKGHTSVVKALVLSTNQQTLYSAGSDERIIIWDLASGTIKHTIEGAHAGPINALAISPDGSRLASAGADGAIHLWDAETGKPLLTLNRQEGPVNALVFTRNGKSLASGGQALHLWDLKTQQDQNFYISSGFINALAISPDDRVLISAGTDKTVRYWDVGAHKLINSEVEHTAAVNDVVVSADSLTFITAGADGTVGIWDMNTLKPVQHLEGFDSDVYRVLEAAQGRIITTGGNDFTIKLWQRSEF